MGTFPQGGSALSPVEGAALWRAATPPAPPQDANSHSSQRKGQQAHDGTCPSPAATTAWPSGLPSVSAWMWPATLAPTPGPSQKPDGSQVCLEGGC